MTILLIAILAGAMFSLATALRSVYIFQFPRRVVVEKREVFIQIIIAMALIVWIAVVLL